VSRRAGFVIAIIASACGKGGGPAEPPRPPAPGSAQAVTAVTATTATTAGSAQATAGSATDPGATPPGCEPLPFAESTPVPEASGAAWLVIDGKPALVVISDSGNHGAYGIVDPDTGATLETGTLPLSTEAGDDLEGVAARGDKIYGVTSAGWMRVWQRKGKGFELVGAPYALGPVDLPDTKNEARAPKGDGMVCDPHAVNCGRNYEGLCLAPAPRAGACLGFAASKADGHLYCLTEEAGKLVVHHDRAIAITRPGALADCAFGDDDTLWAGSNLLDLDHVYRVARWEDPANAQVERVAALGVGFPEGIAARGDVVYRMSDLGGAPSLMARYRCRK
jgi:outer membrane protein assembly factor BamB